jgi:hypothetical protein
MMPQMAISILLIGLLDACLKVFVGIKWLNVTDFTKLQEIMQLQNTSCLTMNANIWG